MNLKIFFVFLFVYTCLDVRGQISFEKDIWRNDSINEGNDVIQTSDEGYLGIGNFIFRTNKYGDTIWTKKILTKGHSIAALPNDEFILLGEMNGICATACIDNDGKVKWIKEYPWASKYAFTKKGSQIRTSADNNYIFLSEGWIVKINPLGDTLWSFNFGDSMKSVVELDSNYYALNSSFELAKLDNFGKQVWRKSYGDEYMGGGEIVKLDNNELILLSSQHHDVGYLIICKINSNGDTLWKKNTKLYVFNNGPITKFSAIAADDGFAVFAGTSFMDSSIVVNFDKDGNQKWIRSYIFKSRSGNSIQQTRDGGYILIGSSIEEKMKLIKVNPEGLISGVYHEENSNMNVFPNPFTTSTTFYLEKIYNHLELNLYNINGILECKINIERDSKIYLERGALRTGIYLFEINDGYKTIQRGKTSIF